MLLFSLLKTCYDPQPNPIIALFLAPLKGKSLSKMLFLVFLPILIFYHQFSYFLFLLPTYLGVDISTVPVLDPLPFSLYSFPRLLVLFVLFFY